MCMLGPVLSCCCYAVPGTRNNSCLEQLGLSYLRILNGGITKYLDTYYDINSVMSAQLFLLHRLHVSTIEQSSVLFLTGKR